MSGTTPTSSYSSATTSGFSVQAAYTLPTASGAAQKAVFLQELKPAPDSLKSKIVSPNPEITDAIAKGTIEKVSLWLRAKGWKDMALGSLNSSFVFASLFHGLAQASDDLACELLKQAIERRDKELFLIVPKSFLRNLQDLAEIIDLLKKDDPFHREMLEIIKQIAPPDKFQLFMNSRPLNPVYPLHRQMTENMAIK